MRSLTLFFIFSISFFIDALSSEKEEESNTRITRLAQVPDYLKLFVKASNIKPCGIRLEAGQAFTFEQQRAPGRAGPFFKVAFPVLQWTFKVTISSEIRRTFVNPLKTWQHDYMGWEIRDAGRDAYPLEILRHCVGDEDTIRIYVGDDLGVRNYGCYFLGNFVPDAAWTMETQTLEGSIRWLSDKVASLSELVGEDHLKPLWSLFGIPAGAEHVNKARIEYEIRPRFAEFKKEGDSWVFKGVERFYPRRREGDKAISGSGTVKYTPIGELGWTEPGKDHGFLAYRHFLPLLIALQDLKELSISSSFENQHIEAHNAFKKMEAGLETISNGIRKSMGVGASSQDEKK